MRALLLDGAETDVQTLPPWTGGVHPAGAEGAQVCVGVETPAVAVG